ncbi:ATP-binding protein [Chloroflexus sp. Y-396-1]|uniref:hybrid sensor histidine kinase/response regulator n=1 Tax=Chloroflexus sp. Y-396-1 TaxID=867845 RepID=UPI00048B2ECC|nr:ATP-binding protein [Chloroflexus sp. Y-396-1]
MTAFPDPPSSTKDYLHQHRYQLLRELIWLLLLMVFSYTILAPIDPTLIPLRLLIVVPLLVVLLVSLRLLQNNSLRAAGILAVGALWLTLIVAAFIGGGLQSPAFVALPLVVIISGILLGQRSAWLITVLSIAVSAVFVYADDLLPPHHASSSARFWFVTYIFYFLLAARTITYVISHFSRSIRETQRELTEREAVEQRLRVSEEKLARLFDSTPFATLIVRLADNLILNANAACREFFELSSDQIIKQRIDELDWSQLPAQWSTIVNTLHQQGTIRDVEFSFCRQDGTTHFVQLAAEIVELPEGLCAVIAFQDVTPLRRANERLAELATQQEQLATLARDALANADLDTLFSAAMSQTAQTLHLSGIELIDIDSDGFATVRNRWGQVPDQPFPDDFFRHLPADHPGWSKLPAALAERFPPATSLHGAVIFICGQERRFGALLVYASAPLDAGAIFFLQSVATVLAVAIERFYAEQERRRIESQMLQTQKLESLGLLAGGIAHDFNNLLTGIIGHTSLALLDLPPNHQLQPHLTAIDQAAQRAAELCNQLLVYAGRGQRSLEMVDLSTLVREMSDILRLPTNRSSQVTIHYELDSNLPPVVVEASQIRQIVLNLLTNAIEAIGERVGTVTLRTGVIILTATDLRRLNLMPTIPPGEYVTLTVSDTGIGMDEATQRRIFDPFFSTKPKGHGLGLAAVQGIVRRHQGAIQVNSAPGLGSTFTVYLPATRKAVSPAAKPQSMPVILRGTALIVDDEAVIRTTLSRILERAGMVTIEAANGHGALTLLTETALRIDIAVVDLAMPGMNGLELLAAIRQRYPKLPVLLMSGNPGQVTDDSLPLDQYTDFIPKPYRSQDLLEKMSHLLQRVTSTYTR